MKSRCCSSRPPPAAYRVGALALARPHEREEIELALFGGRYKHGAAGLV